MDIKKVQQIEFDMLCYIDDFCKKNNINYFLGYGTLLGAVREHDFIPWDNDADIFVPRKDYNRLIELFNKEDSKYRFICHENSREFYLPYGKIYDSDTKLAEFIPNPVVMGVYVDVYPLENMPDDYEEACNIILGPCNKLLFRMLSVKNTVLFRKRRLRSTIKLLFIKIALLPLTRYRVNDLIVKRFAKNKNYNSKYVYSVSSNSVKHDIYEREYFKSKVIVNIKNKEFAAPCGYDEILKQIYGNYMELPPVENRTANHYFNYL